MVKKLLMAICLVMCVSFSSKAQNEVVTNEMIISLLKEGFGADEIIGLIEMGSERQIVFDLNAMRQLKEAGADSQLIKYIQKIAKVDHGYEGVYWWNPSDGGKPHKLHRTTFEFEQSGMNGGWLGVASVVAGVAGYGHTAGNLATVGVLSSSASIKKVAMPGEHARIVMTGAAASNPVFRFYFQKTADDSFEKTGDAWWFHMMNEIESPNEFQCIRMKSKKNKRTFPDGLSYSVMGFFANKTNKDIVEFEIKDISNNIFEVTFPNGLEPGEYCFFYKNGQNSKWFQEHMFGFDFSVQ